jgi:hypothetical protein
MSALNGQMPLLNASDRFPLLALMEETETTTPDCSKDFNSPESGRALGAAAMAVAYEMGCQAAREYFSELINNRPASP